MDNPLQIQLVLADVDGTLVTPDKKLTGRARAVVRKLGDLHIAFAITSGRPPRGMAMLIEPLGLRTPIAGFNGGMTVTPEMVPIEIKAVPPDLVASIVDGLISRGLDAWIYQGNDWYLRDSHAPHADREQRTVGFAPIVTDELEKHTEGVTKIVGVSDDLPKVGICENAMRAEFGYRVAAVRSQPYYLDVTHPDANKGEVCRRLSAELRVPRDAIATLGDQRNDIDMFSLSGVSIAMGQASEDVRRAAGHVTKPNTEDGFAEAVERYVLNGGG